MLLVLFAILHEDPECAEIEQTYACSNNASVLAEPEAALDPFAPPQRFTMHMSPAVRSLYHFLFMHRNQDVSMEQMSYYLWNNAQKSHMRTLYCYIHTIRKCLNDVGKQHTLLVCTRPTMYRLNIPEGQEETYKCFE